MDVQKLLAGLFDYQHFESEPALQSMIDEVRPRYLTKELSDDTLSTLSAAGDPYTQITDAKKRNKTE